MMQGKNLVGFADRPRPENLEAEQALLGALLVSNDALDGVRDLLRAEHFSQPVHGRLFGAVCALVDRGDKADPVTVRGYFAGDDALSAVGGSTYVDKLAASVISIVGAASYARAIIECYALREIQEAAAYALEATARPDPDVSSGRLASELSAALDRVVGLEPRGGFMGHGDVLDSALVLAERAFRGEGIRGVRTGLPDLDEIIGGLENSSVTVLAGATSMGKTALADAIADNVAQSGIGVAFYSLEMACHQLAQRALARATGIPLTRIVRGELSPDEMSRLFQVRADRADLPFYVDDTPGITIGQVRDRARALRRRVRGGVGLVVVDYLQLVEPDDRYAGQRVNEVAAVSRGLKLLARSLDVPVLALCQLSRKPGQRDDHRPALGDLRDSGAIEQDADNVLLLYRRDYYEPEPPADPAEAPAWHAAHGRIEVIVAKQRQGPTGSVWITADLATGNFGDGNRGPQFRLPPPAAAQQSDFDLGHPNAPGRP